MTRKAERRPVRGTEAANGQPSGRRAVHTITDTTGPVLAVAEGLVYPPSGRRQLALVLVADCPHCRGAHMHRSAPAGLIGNQVRAGSCGGRYRVRADGAL